MYSTAVGYRYTLGYCLKCMLHGGECKPYREQCNKQALLQPWCKPSSLMYGIMRLPMFLQTANNIEGMCVMSDASWRGFCTLCRHDICYAAAATPCMP